MTLIHCIYASRASAALSDADIQSLMVMEHLAVGNALQSEDAKEGVQAFLEKREPKWVGR